MQRVTSDCSQRCINIICSCLSDSTAQRITSSDRLRSFWSHTVSKIGDACLPDHIHRIHSRYANLLLTAFGLSPQMFLYSSLSNRASRPLLIHLNQSSASSPKPTSTELPFVSYDLHANHQCQQHI